MVSYGNLCEFDRFNVSKYKNWKVKNAAFSRDCSGVHLKVKLITFPSNPLPTASFSWYMSKVQIQKGLDAPGLCWIPTTRYLGDLWGTNVFIVIFKMPKKKYERLSNHVHVTYHIPCWTHPWHTFPSHCMMVGQPSDLKNVGSCKNLRFNSIKSKLYQKHL